MGQLRCLDIFFEEGPGFRQVKANALEVRIGKSDLHGQVALRGADVGGGLVLGPGKCAGDGDVGAVAQARHGP